LRAKPEPTQLEWLSDASFLGKLLVLPANVRLDWKVFARCKHSSVFGLVVSNEEKSFITLTPGVSVTKLLKSLTEAKKLSFSSCSLASLSRLVYYMRARTGAYHRRVSSGLTRVYQAWLE
jgi:hypothetical protein